MEVFTFSGVIIYFLIEQVTEEKLKLIKEIETLEAS